MTAVGEYIQNDQILYWFYWVECVIHLWAIQSALHSLPAPGSPIEIAAKQGIAALAAMITISRFGTAEPLLQARV